MPHSRDRHETTTMLASLKWSPAVGVFGLRQVGKTTLVQSVASRLHGDYETFDMDATLASAEEAPLDFLTRSRLLAIDEAQKAPIIFSVIKTLIGTRRTPGRFLLTGSVRFTLKEDIRESLTGRILLHELLPFTVAEAHSHKPSTFLQTLFSIAAQRGPVRENFWRHNWKIRYTPQALSRHALTGGMPIPCFARAADLRRRWFEDYFGTLVTRDLALTDSTLRKIGYRQGMAFLRELAFMQGRELNISALAHASVMTLAMARKVLRTLEMLSLIDLIPPEKHGNKSHRKMRIEWKDIALRNHAAGALGTSMESDFTSLEMFISQELRAQASLMPAPAPAWTSLRTRDGADIPWIFRHDRKTLAMILRPAESPRPMDWRTLKRFIGKDPQTLGVILGLAKTPPMAVDQRILLLPYTAVF